MGAEGGNGDGVSHFASVLVFRDDRSIDHFSETMIRENCLNVDRL